MMQRLVDAAPYLQRVLTDAVEPAAAFPAARITRETVHVTVRDGTRLATDLYFPPDGARFPVVAIRTPYGRARLGDTLLAIARRGYVVIAQDCRGTGDSEPEAWDYYVYEREDSWDLVEWVCRQSWCDGFISGCGGSYVAQTQWCMALHSRMTTIAPEVGGLGVASHRAHLYMFLNAYARSVGKGSGKVAIAYDELERQMTQETLAGGYFNEPLHQPFRPALLQRYPTLGSLAPIVAKRWLWEHYCTLPAAERAELIRRALDVDNVSIASIEALSSVFGQHVAHDAHMFPARDPAELCRCLHATPLMVTGWYDWGLNDALATWELLMREARPSVRDGSRLIITPAAHGTAGYHEGEEEHPELQRSYRTANIHGLLLQWYADKRADALASWPKVIYYLMGANEWRASSAWPPAEAQDLILYLGTGGALTRDEPHPGSPTSYVYDPHDPPMTLGGSILSYVYPPGSVDVSVSQQRPDVLTYTTAPLAEALDVVGPVRLILYASSSAVDTDFSARLSDVFPDGRAIQLQSGLLRARYRSGTADPALLEPGRIYRLEVDMWATANRFKAGHRLRVDICSADFPRFDRNANRGGASDSPIPARQTVYHDPEHPSHLQLSVCRFAD